MRYHYIITVQHYGASVRTQEGIYTGDGSRQQAYYHICDQLNEREPYSVLFFSMEPEQL